VEHELTAVYTAIAEVFAAGTKTSAGARRRLARILPAWQNEPCPFGETLSLTLKAANRVLYPEPQ
jgi:hypothetical protein